MKYEAMGWGWVGVQPLSQTPNATRFLHFAPCFQPENLRTAGSISDL